MEHFSIEAESSVERIDRSIYQSLQTASVVKSLARKTQLGSVFTFTPAAGLSFDGVFRTSMRGWFTFAHSLFTFGSLVGHIWHGGRALFRDIWLGF
jgi:photosystem II CP47 chlorophyll apoprotein